MIINKELTVKVVASGYIDLVECKDPQLCAQVLGLLLREAKPETAEQRLIRELEEKHSNADTKAILADDRAKKAEKQVAELQTQVKTLVAEQTALRMAAKAPIPVPEF